MVQRYNSIITQDDVESVVECVVVTIGQGELLVHANVDGQVVLFVLDSATSGIGL